MRTDSDWPEGDSSDLIVRPPIDIMQIAASKAVSSAPRELRLCRDCCSRFEAHPESERRSCDRCVRRKRKAAGYA